MLLLHDSRALSIGEALLYLLAIQCENDTKSLLFEKPAVRASKTYMNKNGPFHIGNIHLVLGRAAATTNRTETQSYFPAWHRTKHCSIYSKGQ